MFAASSPNICFISSKETGDSTSAPLLILFNLILFWSSSVNSSNVLSAKGVVVALPISASCFGVAPLSTAASSISCCSADCSTSAVS